MVPPRLGKLLEVVGLSVIFRRAPNDHLTTGDTDVRVVERPRPFERNPRIESRHEVVKHLATRDQSRRLGISRFNILEAVS